MKLDQQLSGLPIFKAPLLNRQTMRTVLSIVPQTNGRRNKGPHYAFSLTNYLSGLVINEKILNTSF